MTHPKWKTKDEFPGSISLPFGVKTSHTWHEVGQLLRIINDFDINMFIEIGCHVGGLASIINCRKFYQPGFSYIGYDINGSVVDDHVNSRCDIRIKDVFKDPIHLTIQQHKNTFVYCDGGNKVKEMKTFAPSLKSGDIIACHDYFDGQKVVGLDGFGFTDKCGCKPEVWLDNLKFIILDESFELLPDYLLEGTRIMGYRKK